MKRLIFALAASTAFAAPAIAQTKDTTVQLDAIVAVVGNVPITRYDIERRLGDSLAAFMQRGAGMPSKSIQQAMVTSALNDLVDEEVMLLKAKDMAIEVPEVDVTTAIDNLVKEVSARYPSQTAFRQALAEAGFGTPEEYRRTMTLAFRRTRMIELLISKLRQENKIPPVQVPEAKVQEEFERLKNAGLRKRMASLAWRQMVIAPMPSVASKAIAKAKADSLRAEIKAGGDFERIAKRESMDVGTKELGGDLGWRRRGDLPIELERLLFGPFQIRPAEVSAVVESPFGFHILRIDRANPPAEVKVRQILIIPKVDSADVTRASFLADSLIGALRRGAPFDTIARHFHDPAEDAAGLIPEIAFDSLPASYQAGLKDVKKDSIVAFSIPTASWFPKYVIAQVSHTTEPGEYTYNEVKARVRFQLQQVLQTRRYIDQQRKTVYVRTFPDRAIAAARIFSAPPGGP